MSTITVVLDNQCIDFEVTHYCPRLPATLWEPEEPPEIEWQAADPSIQALIDHFGLLEDVEKLIVAKAEKDRAEADFDAGAEKS